MNKFWVGGGITDIVLVGKIMSNKVVIQMNSCADGSTNSLQNLRCFFMGNNCKDMHFIISVIAISIFKIGTKPCFDC